MKRREAGLASHALTNGRAGMHDGSAPGDLIAGSSWP